MFIPVPYNNFRDLQLHWPPEDTWSSLVLALPAAAGTLLDKHKHIN